MKSLVITTVTSLVLIISSFSQVRAQSFGELTTYNVSPFDELQIQVTSQIIIKKSDRNLIRVQEGHSPLKIEEDNGIISLSVSDKKIENQPTIIVIETTSLNSLVAGGYGNYHIIGLDEKVFSLLNPAASVAVQGKVSTIQVNSVDGFTNLEYLSSRNENISISGRGKYKSGNSLNKELVYNAIQEK